MRKGRGQKAAALLYICSVCSVGSRASHCLSCILAWKLPEISDYLLLNSLRLIRGVREFLCCQVSAATLGSVMQWVDTHWSPRRFYFLPSSPLCRETQRSLPILLFVLLRSLPWVMSGLCQCAFIPSITAMLLPEGSNMSLLARQAATGPALHQSPSGGGRHAASLIGCSRWPFWWRLGYSASLN